MRIPSMCALYYKKNEKWYSFINWNDFWPWHTGLDLFCGSFIIFYFYIKIIFVNLNSSKCNCFLNCPLHYINWHPLSIPNSPILVLSFRQFSIWDPLQSDIWYDGLFLPPIWFAILHTDISILYFFSKLSFPKRFYQLLLFFNNLIFYYILPKRKMRFMFSILKLLRYNLCRYVMKQDFDCYSAYVKNVSLLWKKG